MLVGAVLRVGRTVRRRCHPWETYTPSVQYIFFSLFSFLKPLYDVAVVFPNWKGGKKVEDINGRRKEERKKRKGFLGMYFCAAAETRQSYIFLSIIII